MNFKLLILIFSCLVSLWWNLDDTKFELFEVPSRRYLIYFHSFCDLGKEFENKMMFIF